MPCHYKSVKSFKWSIPNSDVKIDYHKKFSFQSFDFCVNSFVKGSLASDRAISKSELARIPLTNGFTQKSKLWNENLSSSMAELQPIKFFWKYFTENPCLGIFLQLTFSGRVCVGEENDHFAWVVHLKC